MVERTDEVHIRDYWLILEKRWRIIALSFAVVVAAAALISWKQTPIYQASVEMVISPNLSQLTLQAEPARFLYDRTFLVTQSKRIRTRSLMAEVAADLMPHAAGFFPRPEASEMPASELKEALTDLLLSSVRVVPERDTRVFTIIAQHSDPTVVALTANTVADTYKRVTDEEQMASSVASFNLLTDELGKLRTKMQTEEANLLELRQQSGLIAVGSDEPLAASKLAELSAQRAEMSMQKLELQKRLERIGTALEQNGPEAAASWVKTNEVAELGASLSDVRWHVEELSKKYGEKWPALIAARNDESLTLQRLESAVRAEEAAATAELDGLIDRLEILGGAITEFQTEVGGFSEAQVQYSILQGELTASRDMYQILLGKLQEVDMSQSVGALSVSIIERAQDLPAGAPPVRPKRALNMAFGALVGVFLGAGLAFFQEYLDNTVKTADEVKQLLGVPLLGVVPAIVEPRGGAKGKVDARALRLISNQSPKSPIAEAYRALRTNIQFSSLDAPARALLVTSGGQGEGKSTTTVNFGSVIAQSGKRVLLVDSDLRRPILHKALGCPNNVGLTSVLIKEASLGEAVQDTRVEGLSVLTSGPLPPNPAELLGSEAMKQVVRQATEEFDVVLFDSPPLAPVTDSAVLASEVDGVVLVIGAGKTPREICLRAKSLLDNVQANILGAVLNNMQVRERGQYYYYYYHRYGYDYGESRKRKKAGAAS